MFRFVFLMLAVQQTYARYVLEHVTSDVNGPNYLTYAPGETNLYIVETRGYIKVVKGDETDNFLNITSVVNTGSSIYSEPVSYTHLTLPTKA